VLGGVAVGRGFETQSDQQLFSAKNINTDVAKSTILWCAYLTHEMRAGFAYDARMSRARQMREKRAESCANPMDDAVNFVNKLISKEKIASAKEEEIYY
jgi:hypothetical protein